MNETREEPTIYRPVRSPYGIPYRCLYSVNIENLMFAGRNISATHTANASTRVMATCGVLGQAVGTAAAIAIQENLTPRGVYELRIHKLQRQLQEDDCYLPGIPKEKNPLMEQAQIVCNAGEAGCLTDGVERTLDGNEHLWKEERENHQRLVKIPLGKAVREIKVIPQKAWGAEEARIYRLDLRP